MSKYNIDPARDYVMSHFQAPRDRSFYMKPPGGFLRCSTCGNTVLFVKDKPYEEQCACIHDDCMGQMFCNQWRAWRDA